EIVVENAHGSVVRFGPFLMQHVQDYFCACIARRAAGYPLQSRAGARRLCLAHPLAFAVCLLALVASVAFAFSSQLNIPRAKRAPEAYHPNGVRIAKQFR
ncbi:MAG: hypothetical protein IJG70_02980, partial [Kiritimatiellae bacterium]|nr:hypothetical protein [Kiritimatiellia bacterium]